MRSTARLKVRNLGHISIAVRSIEEATALLQELLGARLLEGKAVGYSGDFYYAHLGIGQLRVELIQPMGERGPIGKFIERRGEGLHHISFEVDDIHKAIEFLERKGYRIAERFTESETWRTVFLSPNQTLGVLIQLHEPHRPRHTRSADTRSSGHPAE